MVRDDGTDSKLVILMCCRHEPGVVVSFFPTLPVKEPYGIGVFESLIPI